MAGMFYSQQEAAEKLGMTEEEVKQLATEGKLREFRDGASVMFKIDEVEGLAAESGSDLDDFSAASEPVADADELDPLLEKNTIDDRPAAGAGEEVSVPEEGTAADKALDDLIFEDDSELTPESEAPVERAEPSVVPEEEVSDTLEEEPVSLTPKDAAPHESDGLDELLNLASDSEGDPLTKDLELLADDSGLEPIDDLQLEEELSLDEPELTMKDETPGPAAEKSAVDLADDTQVVPADKSEVEPTGDAATTVDGMDDTALTTEGISVLGESDAEFQLTDDTLAETLAGLGGTGDTTSLEDIEDDINLDSFGGSGSGLLDLSLQADDTSLGGILDEIYTSDEGGGSPAKEDSIGSTEGVSADLDSAGGDEGVGIETYAPALGPPMAGEAPPDASSNMLGGLLFLPLAVLVYTTIVAVSALNGTVPGIVSSIQGIIWYILGGLALVGLVVGVKGLTGSAGGDTKKPRAKKAKKAAKEKKAKKEKKPKREKKAKKK